MTTTIKTIYIYNIKTINIPTIKIENTKDRWVGDNNCNVEKSEINYIKQELRL